MRHPSAMRVVSGASIVLVLAVLVSGCGGGGGGTKLTWKPYTPPEDIAPAEEQWEGVAGWMAGVPWWIEDEPPEDVKEEVVGQVSWTCEDVMNFMAYLVGEESGESVATASGRGNGQLLLPRLVARCCATILGKGGVSPAQASTTPIDWTDPETGTRWTGTLKETDTSLSLRAEGKNDVTGTKIQLQISATETDDGAKANASYSVKGTWYGNVWVRDPEEDDWNKVPGRTTFDVSGTLSMLGDDEEDFEYSGKERGWGKEERRENGDSYALVSQWEGSGSGEGRRKDGRENYEGQFDDRDGRYIGDGLYWTHVVMDYEVALEDGELTRVDVTFNCDTSSGVKGYLKATTSGVTGWIKNASGQVVAEVTGTFAEAYITWKKTGEREPLWD